MIKKFENLDQVTNDHTFLDMYRWNKERYRKQKDLEKQIGRMDKPQVDQLRSNRNRTSITWVGHSTFLIQIAGTNILTDPVWARRMGFQTRLTEPGIKIDDLPPIDVVLISHGHYDHLDFASIRQLKDSPEYFVPIGLGKTFVKKGYDLVHEANWWETFEYGDLSFHFVPAQHWTRRGIFDMNTSHWGGWVIENKRTSETIYFVGDTGYFRGFKDVAEKFNLNYVLMPIGAYEPEWFMASSHINPEDAVRAFLELDGDYFIPMHYGAYRLADDTGPEALGRLLAEWDRRMLAKEKLKALLLGETFWAN